MMMIIMKQHDLIHTTNTIRNTATKHKKSRKYYINIFIFTHYKTLDCEIF